MRMGVGSSPLARGLRLAEGYYSRELRIIPARAGFTTISARKYQYLKDHPRSRGVYGSRLISMRMGVGSSPLARGLRLAEGYYSRELRIIPARAGFTTISARKYQYLKDHPRSRGVYYGK